MAKVPSSCQKYRCIGVGYEKVLDCVFLGGELVVQASFLVVTHCVLLQLFSVRKILFSGQKLQKRHLRLF